MAAVLTHAKGRGRDQSRWRAYPLLIGLFALAVAVRIAFLDRQSLWFDEGVGLIFSGCEFAGQCLDRMLETRTSERFQLLYPLLLHGWRELFGSDEIALRSLSVLLGTAAIPLVWRTAVQEFGNTHAAWSLAFMGLSAFTLIHAQEARPYTLFLLIAAAQVCLLLAAKRGSRTGLIGFYLVTALASWTGLFPLLFSIALALGDLASGPSRWKSARQWLLRWLPAGLLCVPATAYYLISAVAADPSRVGVPRSDNPLFNLIFVAYGHLVGQTYGPPVEELRGTGRTAALLGSWHLLAALAIVGAFAAAQMMRLMQRGRLTADRGAIGLLAYSAAAYVALCFAFAVLTRHNWLPRHAIALHPLIALLLPLLTRPAVPGGSAWSGRAIMSALLLLNVVSIGHHFFNQAHWKDDYRGVARYLEQHGEPHRPVALLRGLPVLLEYYGYDQFTYANDPPPAQAAAHVRRAAQGRPEVVVVVNREVDLWPPGWLDGALAPDFRLVDREHLPYFAIYTYARQ